MAAAQTGKSAGTMSPETRKRAREGAEQAFIEVMRARHPGLDFIPVRSGETADDARARLRREGGG